MLPLEDFPPHIDGYTHSIFNTLVFSDSSQGTTRQSLMIVEHNPSQEVKMLHARNLYGTF